MKNQKINIGIVGCGNIAEKYLEQISNYQNIKLIGLTDIDIDRAKNFSDLYNCQLYDNLDKMLLDENIDLIVCFKDTITIYSSICLNSLKI